MIDYKIHFCTTLSGQCAIRAYSLVMDNHYKIELKNVNFINAIIYAVYIMKKIKYKVVHFFKYWIVFS